MKKITSLCLSACIILSSIFLLISCSGLSSMLDEPDQRLPSSIVIPGRALYSRPVVSYDSVEYERPDIDATTSAIKNVAAQIESGVSFKRGVELIKSIEDDYLNVNTMYTLSEINFMKNSNDEFWSAEYDYVSTGLPAFQEALEDMFVACAQSPDREKYENDYFMYSLEEYVDGGIYTPRLVSFLESEATLEAEYMEINEQTAVISYENIVGTYDYIMTEYGKRYGTYSTQYEIAEEECYQKLASAITLQRRQKFTELIRIRRQIANELGLDSYSEYAYSAMGYEYTDKEMTSMLNTLRETVYPVYLTLYERAFRSFFYNNQPSEIMPYTTVNNIYDLYTQNDDIVNEAYSYMLKCGLYDISESSAGRYNGAFTTYIYGIDAPFLFMTAEGYVTDYLTLSHEYGHFLDSYINGPSNTSLDLSEVSSQALELMTIPMLEGVVSDKDLQYLEYYQMYSALEILLIQGYYSMFEHMVYELPANEINEENLDKIAAKASKAVFGSELYTDFSSVLIQHTAIYPHYVQSYCTSLVSSLEIFFIEEEEEGRGMEIYLDLLTRDSEEYLTFTEELEGAGLSSPFEKETLKKVIDSIHYKIIGSHYFKQADNPNAA